MKKVLSDLKNRIDELDYKLDDLSLSENQEKRAEALYKLEEEVNDRLEQIHPEKYYEVRNLESLANRIKQIKESN